MNRPRIVLNPSVASVSSPFVSFTSALHVYSEIPSNLACKWMGPGKFLPLLIFLFGLFSMCFAFVNDFGQAFAVRFLLGLSEAGVLPGIFILLE